LKSLHIVVPDLFSSLVADKRVTADLSLPVLNKCLARATRQQLPAQNLADYLGVAFGVKQGELAPILATSDGLTLGDGFWFRADPVHLNVQPSRMIVQTNVQPTATDAAQICHSLNAHFEQDGWQFFAPHPTRWYLHVPEMPDLQTHAIFEVDGCDARQFQPSGKAALRWNAQLTELQMLLNSHPVNLQIEARGGLSINSVWWWGGGRAAAASGSQYSQVAGDGEMLSALAKWSAVPQLNFADTLSQGNSLWVWDGLALAARRGDTESWRQSLLEFERQCLALAWAALARGEIDQLRLDVLQNNALIRFELSRWSVYKYWRQVRPLFQFVAR